MKQESIVPSAVPSGPSGRPSRGAFQRVLHGIGIAIVAGEFPVGSTLPNKDVLLRRFAVSNTALREALKTLQAKGMVAARTRVGYWVRAQNEWNLLDEDLLAWQLEIGVDDLFIAGLFEMRQSIEPAAAALAAMRRSDAQVDKLRDLANRLRDAGVDRQRFTDVDLDFHLAVIEASGNPMMRSIGAVIGAALAVAFRLSAPTDSLAELDETHAQHLAIAEAIAAADPQGAADAMMAVIDQGSSRIASEIEPLDGTIEIRLHSRSSGSGVRAAD
ncbi:FadR/GntR family transcriptional regulator [Pararhizobium mangrovi]|uniref:FadR family transcriptional regulator n=1 Tax=Pararhizobium mangrovi TaxID=2590452 RepID=A0A506U5D8_9HYPH|nr:FadR/GntR family transcriptional regulator [Pararhizobium mangrovi]TPW28668.1 FadR family transcriptional regulator [Pararhizobium mangrovi]